MPRFFIQPEDLGKEIIRLGERESHHAAAVLRLRRGDEVELLDGQGKSFRGIVAGMKEGRLAVSVISETVPIPSSHCEISVALSVIRPERMEWLIEKACELGVRKIFPVITDRCIVKLSRERWESKLKRWRKIALETCKQCGQPQLPAIQPVGNFSDLFSEVKGFDKIFIPTLIAQGGSVYRFLRESNAKRVLALVGPEGDFTKREVDLALSHGAQAVSLGPLVLRSETAVVYLVSAIHFYFREIAGD